MGASRDSDASLPAWIRRIGVPTWVCDASRQIVYMNELAERLLGVTDEEWLHQPCFSVVSGRDAAGRPFCQEDCAVKVSAHRLASVEPVDLHMDGGGVVRLVPIPLAPKGHKGTWIVHCALDVGRLHRLQCYLESVALRAARDEKPRGRLTPRQVEILNLLEQALNTNEVAERLGITTVTVRNHMQHIMAKLGVHSVHEAMAIYLLGLAE